LAGLLLNPVHLQAAIETGSDMPSFALAIASTFLLLAGRSRRALAGAGGLAVITRYNTAFLLIAAPLVLLARRDLARGLAAYAAGAALPLGAWLVLNTVLSGSPFANRNYANVAYEIYGQGASWDDFSSHAMSRF